MKKYSFLAYIGLIALLFSSCIKEDIKYYQGDTVAEIDATVLNPVTPTLTYPVITRIPVGDRPIVAASDSTIRRFNNTTIRIRVNLVGPQSSKDETVAYTVFTTPPVATIAFGATLTAAQAPPSGQVPSRASATLNLLPAVANTHYFIASTGFLTIPANSSFGFVDVGILNSNTAVTEARFVGIELTNGGTVKPNPNYNKLGIAIDQR